MAAPTDGERAVIVTRARILARWLRDALTCNHERSLTRRLNDRSCPFDLRGVLSRRIPSCGTARTIRRTGRGCGRIGDTTRPLQQVCKLPAAGDAELGRYGWNSGRRTGHP